MRKSFYFLGLSLIIISSLGQAGAYTYNANITMLDGTSASLSDYEGKFLLIDTMATWCEPCKIEMVHLYDRDAWSWGGDRLIIVGVGKGLPASRIITVGNTAARVNGPAQVALLHQLPCYTGLT